MYVTLVAGVVALAASALACSVGIGVLRRLGVVDIPNDRSSHGRSTVRGAGVGVACGTVLGVLAAGAIEGGTWWAGRAPIVVIVGSSCLGAIGLVDDLRAGISFRVRLSVQVIVATAAILALGPLDVAMPWKAIVSCGAMVAVVGYVNAFNFMDGINGISGAAAIVAGGMFVLIGHMEGLVVLEAGGAALAAACLGFLPFNVPTARAFLGDSGSYFIGAWIALLAYVAVRGGVPLDVVIAPLALYLCDTGFTLASRIWRGEQWHAPHRDHAYQRLALGGLGHLGTTTLVLLVTTLLSGLGLVSLERPAWRGVAWLGMVGLLVAYRAAPSLRRRQPGQRATPTWPAGVPGPRSDPAPRRPAP